MKGKLYMKSNLLLLVPFFMDYQSKLVNELRKKYDVTLVNSDQYNSKALNAFKKCSKVRWAKRHLLKSVWNADREVILEKFDDEILERIHLKQDYYCVIFCINGAFISNRMYEYLKKNNPNAHFIFYAWDDMSNLFKDTHVKYFDKRYTYNINDCKKYDATYLPIFVQSDKTGHDGEDYYDIAFIASAHSDRKKIAYELDRKYENKFKLYIHLYDSNNSGDKFCSNKTIEYEEYLNIMRKSKAVFDVPHSMQEGPTTRAFDALLTKTKVITVNQHIKKYPVYSENIFIVNRKDIEIDEKFINKPYVETGYEPLTIPLWIKKIGL